MSGSPTIRNKPGLFLLGAVASLAALFLFALLYLRYGNPPVAASRSSFPFRAMKMTSLQRPQKESQRVAKFIEKTSVAQNR